MHLCDDPEKTPEKAPDFYFFTAAITISGTKQLCTATN